MAAYGLTRGMAAYDLTNFGELLQQLSTEFEKLQAWAAILQEENNRLRNAAVNGSLACNGNSLENGCLDSKGSSLDPAHKLLADSQPVLHAGGSPANGKTGTVHFSETVLKDSSSVPEDEVGLKQEAKPNTAESQLGHEDEVELKQGDDPSTPGVDHEVKPYKDVHCHDTVQFDLDDDFDPAFQEREESCVTELRVWFQKLLDRQAEEANCGARDASEIQRKALTPTFVLSLFRDSDAVSREHWVSSVVSELNSVVTESISTADFSLPRSVMSKHMTSRGPVASTMLAFDAFVELILWKTLEPHLTVKQKRDFLRIREALIKHSIDELIFEFSGLAPPKQERVPFWTRIIEPTVALVILLNAITIGISSDYPWSGWNVFEVVYTCFFIGEIALKVSMYGCKRHFLGPDMAWNLFDMSVVGLAVFDLAVSLLAGSNSALGNFTLMRLARLAKLTRVLRLVRLIRLRFFKELLLLIRGVAAGIRTLAWAFVLLASLVYIVGIMLRQTLGDNEIGRDRIVLFESMCASMFIVFRCFIGDCSLIDGTPLLAHLYELYGYAFVLPWALVTLFVTFGMFNLIMAVFVENVQENAKQKRELTRDDERAQVVKRMRQLVMMFAGKNKVAMEGFSTFPSQGSLSSSFQQPVTGTLQTLNAFRRSSGLLQEMDATNVFFQFGGTITREMFNKVIREPEVHDILDDLDVHVADRTELFDLLDADGNRVIDLSELIHGILKLRSGGADKSDIVGTILGIRSIQKQLSSFVEISLEQNATLHRDLLHQVAALESLQEEVRNIRGPQIAAQEKLQKDEPVLRSI